MNIVQPSSRIVHTERTGEGWGRWRYVMISKYQIWYLIWFVWCNSSNAVGQDAEDDEDDEGDEDDEDDEDNGLFSSDNGPDDLNSGEKFCISDCRDEYPFLATYQTGLDLNLQQLCRNNRKTNLLTFQVAKIISFI